MPTNVQSLEQARALKVAREVMQEVAWTRGVVWKKRIRFEWQTKLRRRFLLELLANGDLRMTDGKTGEIITQGPAWPIHETSSKSL